VNHSFSPLFASVACRRPIRCLWRVL
jgi:hypothetical protein